MAITEWYASSAAISSTEYSMGNDGAGVSFFSDSGVFQTFIDTSDMVAGDELEIRVYEKCRSTDSQALVDMWSLTDVQSRPLFVTPALTLMHGWDMTLRATSGTITVNWSIRQVS